MLFLFLCHTKVYATASKVVILFSALPYYIFQSTCEFIAYMPHQSKWKWIHIIKSSIIRKKVESVDRVFRKINQVNTNEIKAEMKETTMPYMTAQLVISEWVLLYLFMLLTFIMFSWKISHSSLSLLRSEIYEPNSQYDTRKLGLIALHGYSF